jgi:flagella basal body P-ring formation protein FlgA
VVLDAGRVQAVARAAGLSWPNATGMRRITVRAGEAEAPAGAAAAAEGAEVLVYARSLKAGEVITAEDLTWSKVAAGRAPADAPDDADAIIGLAAKKPLRAGAPAAARDLAAAKVIAKDETVSVQFRSGGVSLCCRARR